jgi:GntR family transcriptional regulator, rspAB operon transcriptional repressor
VACVALGPSLIYHHHITPVARPEPQPSLSAKAYDEIRRMIVRLDLAPGAVIREDDLQARLGLGRTPIREAIQRLVRDQFVTVMPRRGMFVSGVDVGELATLYETRAIIEPYAARLACVRGDAAQWDSVRASLAHSPGTPTADLLELDRHCHEAVWSAAHNRFLTDTLDMLYAHSDRLWHLYLADVDDMADAVAEHAAILDALADGNAERAASLTEAHIRAFDAQIRAAVTRRLTPPLAG